MADAPAAPATGGDDGKDKTDNRAGLKAFLFETLDEWADNREKTRTDADKKPGFFQQLFGEF